MASSSRDVGIGIGKAPLLATVPSQAEGEEDKGSRLKAREPQEGDHEKAGSRKY